MDALLLGATFPSVRRYFATTNGVVRMYPGTPLKRRDATRLLCPRVTPSRASLDHDALLRCGRRASPCDDESRNRQYVESVIFEWPVVLIASRT